jgi:mono/diheme cytochrome c family protein
VVPGRSEMARLAAIAQLNCRLSKRPDREYSKDTMVRTMRYAAVVGVNLFALALGAADVDQAGMEFFENKIRPVLAEHCYSCHSQKADSLKAGLYLDTRDGLLKGGDSGPAIVPGDPEQSLLIKAIRYTSAELQMPPKNKKLAPEQIADFEGWVRMGAPDPRTEENAALIAREDKKQNHWAFQPVRMPELPRLDDANWVKNGVDAFVLAKLRENGLKPSAAADKRTLLRRASFGLTGLPPNAEEMREFLDDPSDRAWENAIDRLLASPHYGERWARHWLDVARYADTKGYVFEEERRYPYSYTYRDYVIRALNEDLPYDRFIVEQIAADLLPLGEDKRPLAAMGFLTLGRRFLNNQADIIDDRIDVVTRGTMGLTVACARCHDHKYDPIPTADYYSLYGVFASSSEPRDKPLLGDSALPKQFPAYEIERKKRVQEQEEYRVAEFAKVRKELRARAAEYMLAARDAENMSERADLEKLARERKLHPGTVRKWKDYLAERKKSEHDPIFAPWFAFAGLSETNFAAEAKVALNRLASTGANPLNPLVSKAFSEAPESMKQVSERYKELFVAADEAWAEAEKEKKERLASEEQEQVRQILYADGSPARIDDGEVPRLFDVPVAQKSRALQRKVEELDATHPGAPPRGMVLTDNATPVKQRIFIRGAPGNQGDEVPRQFLSLVAGPDRKPFEKGSGRLEMAEAIASRDNPLTARVLVNRVWLNHFGSGLVRTPSDFGVRSDPPTHPELLDYLAACFMDNGWSMKKLHKLILLSSTYQQASDDNDEYSRKDPNNDLLWRMNRRRLEFEPFRDTLLATSGKLDLKQGGQPVEITSRPFNTRRTVYAFIERQNLPGVFRTFDFASPDTTSPQRFNTTVPQQALFMINSPFLSEQAASLVKRPEIARAEGDAKIARMYELAFQRSPTADEVSMARSFIEEQAKVPPPEQPVPVWQYGYGEVELGKFQLKKFERFPHYTGSAWQAGTKLPDEKLGWVTLNAAGGHRGRGSDRAVVRRWTAPEDAAVSISGTLEHSAEAGDGVRGSILSSRHGALGFWPVYRGKREMSISRIEVKKGDTVDFVVDSLGDENSDSFNWAPEIKVIGSGRTAAWRAKEDFAGPPEPVRQVSPWEKYAQVLLMSNELAFVD